MLHAVYNTSQTQQLLWLLISVSLRTAHTDCILHLGINPVWYNALHTSSITPCLVFALYSAQHSIAIPVGTYFLDITQLHITSGSHPTSHPPANTSGSHNNNTQVHTTSLEPLWSSNTVHNVDHTDFCWSPATHSWGQQYRHTCHTTIHTQFFNHRRCIVSVSIEFGSDLNSRRALVLK